METRQPIPPHASPAAAPDPAAVRYAGMMAALGHESRLRVVRLLLATHPQGLVAGEIQAELGIPPSTLSHHLDTLRQEGLVEQVREGRFLRYLASDETLRELLDFLYAECCSHNAVVPASAIGRPRS
jgi:DNA-binding transcriptional ArsR family regulator